jgi:hypothetical protein
VIHNRYFEKRWADQFVLLATVILGVKHFVLAIFLIDRMGLVPKKGTKPESAPKDYLTCVDYTQ